MAAGGPIYNRRMSAITHPHGPLYLRRLHTEEAKANTTDPDSRIMKTRQGYVQGYNAQAVVSEGQIIVAVGEPVP